MAAILVHNFSSRMMIGSHIQGLIINKTMWKVCHSLVLSGFLFVGPEQSWNMKPLLMATLQPRPTSLFLILWRSLYRCVSQQECLQLLCAERKHVCGAKQSDPLSRYVVWTAVLVLVSQDGISDRVQGEYSGRGAEGAAPQHGMQPERPLPPALFCHTKGAGF